MKFAIHNGTRIEATPKAKGQCPCCRTEVIPICGSKRVWHWRHKTKQTCDPWWENETEWHRDWKNKFPLEWQEIVHFSEDGEKHIADVKTPDGFIIEFQHSQLRNNERQAREAFYRNMAWIVDGMTPENQCSLFKATRHDNWIYWKTGETKYFNSDELPEKWLHSGVKVYFDLGYVSYDKKYAELTRLKDIAWRKVFLAERKFYSTEKSFTCQNCGSVTAQFSTWCVECKAWHSIKDDRGVVPEAEAKELSKLAENGPDRSLANNWNSHLICLDPIQHTCSSAPEGARSLYAVDRVAFIGKLKTRNNEAPF